MLTRLPNLGFLSDDGHRKARGFVATRAKTEVGIGAGADADADADADANDDDKGSLLSLSDDLLAMILAHTLDVTPQAPGGDEDQIVVRKGARKERTRTQYRNLCNKIKTLKRLANHRMASRDVLMQMVQRVCTEMRISRIETDVRANEEAPGHFKRLIELLNERCAFLNYLGGHSSSVLRAAKHTLTDETEKAHPASRVARAVWFCHVANNPEVTFALAQEMIAQPDIAEGVFTLETVDGDPRGVITDDGFKHLLIARRVETEGGLFRNLKVDWHPTPTAMATLFVAAIRNGLNRAANHIVDLRHNILSENDFAESLRWAVKRDSHDLVLTVTCNITYSLDKLAWPNYERVQHEMMILALGEVHKVSQTALLYAPFVFALTQQDGPVAEAEQNFYAREMELLTEKRAEYARDLVCLPRKPKDLNDDLVVRVLALAGAVEYPLTARLVILLILTITKHWSADLWPHCIDTLIAASRTADRESIQSRTMSYLRNRPAR
jgi:hypothetical protein